MYKWDVCLLNFDARCRMCSFSCVPSEVRYSDNLDFTYWILWLPCKTSAANLYASDTCVFIWEWNIGVMYVKKVCCSCHLVTWTLNVLASCWISSHTLTCRWPKMYLRYIQIVLCEFVEHLWILHWLDVVCKFLIMWFLLEHFRATADANALRWSLHHARPSTMTSSKRFHISDIVSIAQTIFWDSSATKWAQ